MLHQLPPSHSPCWGCPYCCCPGCCPYCCCPCCCWPGWPYWDPPGCPVLDQYWDLSVTMQAIFGRQLLWVLTVLLGLALRLASLGVACTNISLDQAAQQGSSHSS